MDDTLMLGLVILVCLISVLCISTVSVEFDLQNTTMSLDNETVVIGNVHAKANVPLIFAYYISNLEANSNG